MTAFADMKTRVIGEMNRDDMGSGGEAEQRLIDAYTQAITFYADELFWFNRKSGTLTTIASTATAALPSGMRIPMVVTYLGTALVKVELEEIEAVYNSSTPVTGVPTKWAEDEGTVHFWPTPDAVYSLPVYGIADIGVPTSTNEWVVEGLDLIVADTKLRLYRGSFRDVEGAALASQERDEALAKLRRETRRRGKVAATTDLPVPEKYNILTG